MDEWIRYIRSDQIPESGIKVGVIGKFTLVFNRDLTFAILNVNDTFQHLLIDDIRDIESLLALSHEWQIYHKIM